MNILDEILSLLTRIDNKIDKVVTAKEEGYINTKEVAEILHCKISEVYRKVRLNLIPHYRIGGSIKFKKHEILNFKPNGDNKN